MKIIHSGFDTLYFAVQGALLPEAERHLALMKERAVEKQSDVSFTCHDKSGKHHLQCNGKKGGFAYVVDTGHLGSFIAFKKNLNRTEWNGFVEMKSVSFLAYGWEDGIERVYEQLKALGFHRIKISLNRVDYCIDFLNANLRLDPACFVAHSRVKKHIHYESAIRDVHVHKTAMAQSDHVKSVTLGKMPGRQVIIYDKRAEVIEKRKLYWFKAWGIDRHDPTLTVTRVEIRAGKNELVKYNLSTLTDLKRHIGLPLNAASKAIRYVKLNPNDANISRAPLHPIWEAANKRLVTALNRQMSPIEPEALLKQMQLAKAVEYRKQAVGNIGGLLGCLEIEPEDVSKHITHVLARSLACAEGDSEHPLWKNYNRTREKWVVI